MVRINAFRVVALLTLVFCGALLADHWFKAGLCGFDSGCANVTSSIYGQPLGVPLPLLGVIGFALVLGLSLFPDSRLFRTLRLIAVLAGVAGLALLSIQLIVLKEMCPFCVIVDAAAVILAAIALASPFGSISISNSARVAWSAAGLGAAIAPALFLWPASSSVPEDIKTFWLPDKITVVEVTDFDCRHCKQAELVVRRFLKERGDQIHFVRIVAPMPRHAHAWTAARAYWAAATQDKGELMAGALFSAPARDADTCRDIAAALGLNMQEYDQQVAEQRMDTHLEQNVRWAKIHSSGLPLVWVQDQRLFGSPTLKSLEAAWQRATAHSLSRQ